jgi:hypothetical protein
VKVQLAESYSVFLGVAMEHQLPGRLAFLEDLVAKIDAQYGEAFYAPRMWPTPADFDKPRVAFDIVDQGLKTSKAFVLYYPDKVVSGSLVELGMAISMGLPVHVFTENLENVTYFLREGAPQVSVSTDPSTIWPWIQHTMRPYA